VSHDDLQLTVIFGSALVTLVVLLVHAVVTGWRRRR
jgi:hypothetical protein